MPHNKHHMPERTYKPGESDSGEDASISRHIDDLEGFTESDFDEEAREAGRELTEEELVSLAQGRAGVEDDAAALFTDYEYLQIPKIPEQYRASDIIGKRTQASGKSGIDIGPIRPKPHLRDVWASLTDVEKYILMLVSEHRHLTLAQLESLIVAPSRLRIKKGGTNNTKSYYEWVTRKKYGVDDMDYKATFKTTAPSGLAKKVGLLCKEGLLEEIEPAYSVNEQGMTARYMEAPALFTRHYYLTAKGARVLICNTLANRPGSKERPVGFVPTYKSAAYETILHEAESTEVLCSIISCASYATNPDDGKDYGLFDVCRFYHEKDVEETVSYGGKKIKFKTDGKLTMYVEPVGDFVDWYIEYDAGSSSKDKIRHKVEAFIKYIFHKREEHGEKFRKPVLLLVSQKPADLFPQLRGAKSTTYTTGIKNMARQCFPEHLDILNDIAIVLVADCASIREHGALGACWHRMDLSSGTANMKAYDLIAASTGEGLAVAGGEDAGKAAGDDRASAEAGSAGEDAGAEQEESDPDA